MAKQLSTYLLLFVLLLLAQALICNNILLFGIAMPVVFIYVIVRLPMSMSIPAVLSIAFFYGSIVDVFSDTAGVNAFSCTVIAMLRRPIYELYVGHDSDMADLTPTISTLGLVTYIKYMLTLVVIYFIISYGLIYFSFLHVTDIIGRVLASAGITGVLLTGIDSLIINRRDKKV